MRLAEIPGFPAYLACEDGNIISKKTGRALVGSISNAGYKKLTMINEYGQQKSPSAHRIIATLFCEIPDGDGSFEVNHIDGDKLNNSASNLEWVRHSDNLRHAFEAGLREQDVAPRAVVGKNLSTGVIVVFDSIYKAARALGISQGNICMCCKGARPTASGYEWYYLVQEE